jgi:VWFA-related protein
MGLVSVAVFDRSGAPVADLQKADFTIFDNGQAQDIAIFLAPRSAPLGIALALDFSESVYPMAPTAREAATTFLQALSEEDCVHVLPFQSQVAHGVWVSGRDPEIGRRLGMIPFEGGTALYDAVITGLDRLHGGGRESTYGTAEATADSRADSAPCRASANDHDRRRALVVLTDGNDRSSVAEFTAAVLAATEAGVPIFPVAIGGAADPYWGASNVGRILSNKRNAAQLEELARISGGMVIRSNRSAGLQVAYADVLNALRASYVLGYYLPEASTDSTGEEARWHDIEVSVSVRDLRVLARPGYFASK